MVAMVTKKGIWLGGRDSNPDSQIQSLESYHWTTSQQRSRIYELVTRKSNHIPNGSHAAGVLCLCHFTRCFSACHDTPFDLKIVSVPCLEVHVFRRGSRRSGPRDAWVPISPQDSLRTFALALWPASEKVLAHQRGNQQNDEAASSRVRRVFTVVNSRNIDPESMSQTESPDELDLERLRAVVRDYEKKLAEAADLVARVRHEINNPLAALLGQAQLLLREDLSEKSRRRAEMIESQAKRIEEIAGQLRAVQAPSPAINNSE